MMVQAFHKGISLKGNRTDQLEFELNSYDVVIQHVNHYAIETPLKYYLRHNHGYYFGRRQNGMPYS